MKKSHGPALKRARIELKQCVTCRGTCFIKPMFYELECPDCHASGWVRADDGQPLPPGEMVTQLSIRLGITQKQIDQFLVEHRMSGAQQQYEHNNRLGAGGTNRTGD